MVSHSDKTCGKWPMLHVILTSGHCSRESFWYVVFFVNSMAQKWKLSLPKITNFMHPLSSMTAHELSEEQVGPAFPKWTKHHDRYDPKWEEEFPWLNYVLDHQEDELPLLCSICTKHKESSKRMVWIAVPCKFFMKASFMSMSKCDATWIPLKPKLWL